MLLTIFKSCPRVKLTVAKLNKSFLARDSIYAIARYMLSPVRLSVCHTGGSVKNAWS